MGEFDRAFEESSKGVEPNVQYAFSAAHDRALALLGAGHHDRYREMCARLVDAFQESPGPSNRARVAWLCALTSNPLVHSPQVLTMARASLDDTEDSGLIVGACHYRDSQQEGAVRVLAELAAKLAGGSDSTTRYELACTQYFLALTRFEMGHAFQARQLLGEANRTAEASLQYRSKRSWQKSVRLRALRREATSKLGK